MTRSTNRTYLLLLHKAARQTEFFSKREIHLVHQCFDGQVLINTTKNQIKSKDAYNDKHKDNEQMERRTRGIGEKIKISSD